MRIEYLYTEGDTQHVRPIKVKIDGVITGVIKKLSKGYTYIEKGSKGLFHYKTLSECQRFIGVPLKDR